MTKSKNILTLAFLVTIFFGCGEFEPNVDFAEPIKGRTINLSNKVGDSFLVLRENDTICYSLYFEQLTNFNYLIKSDTDTVFVGAVTKRNELFLLNRPLKNGKFAIHALNFTDSTVTGLETEWLQSNIIKNELDSGKYANLISDTAGVNTLKIKKKDGKEIFRLVNEQLEPEKLISLKMDNSIKDSVRLYSNIQVIIKNSLIKKAYPNPFIDYIVIEMNKVAAYGFQIFDMNGKHIKTSKLKTDYMRMELPNLKSGFYILKVIDSDIKTIDEIKLVKK